MENERWLLPEGIEELLPPQALGLELLRRRVLDLLLSWGYELVTPPLIEYLDSLLTGTGNDLDLQTFKLTDQLSGRLMGVRADMTPQVARIDAHHLRREVPTRLCYLGTVLKTRPDDHGGTRAPLQLGAELYGHPGPESDIEVLALMVAALRGTEYDTELDLALLQEIGFYFHDVRKKYHQFESEYTGVDTRVQINQVPGGMISNLANQLREQGALNRMGEVLEEIPRVREELGYPPLVTPTSQIVGTQAVLNVLTGARYQNITNEVKFYLQGRYGKAPGPVNSMVRRQAIGNEEVIEVRPADLLQPELESLRETIGGLAQSEEDVLTFAMFPEIGREFLEHRAAGDLKPEPLEPPVDEGRKLTAAPTEFNVTLHGETYHIKVTGTGHKTQEKRPFYVTVDGVPEEMMVEVLEELVTEQGEKPAAKSVGGSKRPRATAPGQVTTSMPATIVEVLVKVGDEVTAGAPLLVTEAMKMESEVQAPVAGTIKAVHVVKGDRVNPDEALIEIA